MTAELPVGTAAAPAAGDAASSRWDRLSDRLNPILVREVQQAVKGRMFGITVLGSLLVSVVIAISVASQDRLQPSDGYLAFRLVLMAFCPVALFLVPLSAYGSMRHELRAGIVEQLLLSRLRPWRIVVGKMASSMVQFFLYLSVFAPVLSMTYLLRGVDLPTIALCTCFGLLFSLVATAFAIAAAAQVVVPSLQAVSNIGMVAALGAATVAMMSAVMQPFLMRELTQLARSTEFWSVFSAVSLLCVAATVLFAMVGAALLAHGYENKSTGFRIFLLAAAALFFAWIGVFVPVRFLDDVLPGAAISLVVAGAIFGIFVVGEPDALSPRVREKAPRNPLLAVLLAPMLPGRGRGYLFVMSFQALVCGVAALWMAAAGISFRNEWRVVGFLACYSVIFLGLTKATRGLLPETPMAGMATRIIAPLWIMVGCAVPAVFDALLGGGLRSWHPGHLLNPFWTIGEHGWRRQGDEVLGMLALFAAVVAVSQVVSILRGFAEVLRAHGRSPRAQSSEDAGAA